MENLLIIGDVAGQYDALLRLLDKIPAGEKERIIFVGDLIDRGPKPIETIELIRSNGWEAIFGNHEDFMVDYFRKTNRYDAGIWFLNGGKKTYSEYKKYPLRDRNKGKNILLEHLPWIEKLPWYIETPEHFISHGIWHGELTLEQAQKPFEINAPLPAETNLIWNRGNLIPRNKFQIFGHNGEIQLYFSTPQEKERGNPFALCIDGQREGRLGAFSTKSKTIYTEAF